VTAALGAINAQLRADEHQLRPKTQGDVLQRLAKIIEEQKKLLPPKQPTEHVELERSGAEASMMASRRGDDHDENSLHLPRRPIAVH
jgi:hypothetical protein